MAYSSDQRRAGGRSPVVGPAVVRLDAKYVLADLVIVADRAAKKGAGGMYICPSQAGDDVLAPAVIHAGDTADVESRPAHRRHNGRLEHRRLDRHGRAGNDHIGRELVADTRRPAQALQVRPVAIVETNEAEPPGIDDLATEADRILTKSADVGC